MIEVVPSTMTHARELATNIRDKDQDEARALGMAPHRGLFWAVRHSLLRRTALVRGSVAAMWGVSGTPLGMVGQPYLVTGELVNQVSPMSFARVYKQEVQAFKSLFPVLTGYVASDYYEAIRMLEIGGFIVSKPMAVGPLDKLFRKYELIS